ncbi:C-3 sterol dehydrogenase/C-4 decarboxylase family protein [Xylaria arbuscula]|nr:C-3 sterol dehydrogenase/C-4 decarboxylase family protein [Xylaria arbuscula]
MEKGTPSLGPVIVTGGCGFIGFHLVTDILASEPSCRIHVMDINIDHNQIPNVKYPRCDITSPTAKVNTDGVHNLLHLAKRSNAVRTFINTSITYNLTKAIAEAEVLTTNRTDGDTSLLTVPIRPASTFGERESSKDTCRETKIPDRVVENLGDFICVADLVDAHILAAHLRVDGQCLNVTNDESMRFWDFQRAVSVPVGPPVHQGDICIVIICVAYLTAAISEWQPVITRESVRLTTIIKTLSCEKAKAVLNYKPRVSMQEGLDRTGQWFTEESKREG